MKKFLLILFFLSSVVPVFSQNDSIVITINARYNSRHGYNIDITKDLKHTKLVFSRLDSLSSLLKTDSAFQSYFDAAIRAVNEKNGDSLLGDLLRKIDSTQYVYSYFTRDTVVIANAENPGYIQSLQRIARSKEVELTERFPRTVLDGVHYYFLISSAGSFVSVSAHMPTSGSHPLLHKLLQDTFDLYRKKKNQIIFEPRETFGY